MNKRMHRWYILSMTVAGFIVVLSIGIYGWDYYGTPLPLRPDHAQHGLLSPTGFWGHGMGFIGAFLMTFGVLLYSLRKRARWMAAVGQIKHILELHIFLCLLGPALIVFHSAFKFGGIIGVSFWCMVIVVASGVIGRYLYLQIPKTITGREITPIELEKQITTLRDRLQKDDGIEEYLLQRLDALSAAFTETSRLSIIRAFPAMMIQNIRHDARVRALLQELEKNRNPLSSDAHTRITLKAHLQRQLANLTLTQKMFRYWHMFHLPFAVVMFIIMIAHIVTAFLFGYGWIFTS